MTERWWVIHEDELRGALGRVALGESPDVAMLELTANSTSEIVPPSDG